jgi:hypothetical protein
MDGYSSTWVEAVLNNIRSIKGIPSQDFSFNTTIRPPIDPESLENHMLDALRYLTEPMIKEMEKSFEPLPMMGLSRQINSSQTHFYPDGTVGSEPSNNQVYLNWNNGLIKHIWQYDASNQQWHDITTKESSSLTLESPKTLKCECGAEKCGSDRHSNWCEKHTN